MNDKIFSFDEDVTTWDFWRRDSDENILEITSDDPRDLSSSYYDVDNFDSWTKLDSWTREQAAALTFGRDPNLIKWEDECPVEVWDDLEEFDQQRRTVFLVFAMTELIFKIRTAQELNLLPPDISPRKYAAWLRFSGIPSPSAIWNLFTPGAGTLYKASDTFETCRAPDGGRIRRASDQRKIENNLRKIILALLLKNPGQERLDIPDLSKTIEKRLNEIEANVGSIKGNKLTFERQTIAKRLREVAQLLEASAEDYFKAGH